MRKAERLSKLHGLLFLGCLLWLPSIALSHGTESHNDAPARVERPATVSAEPRGTDAQSSDEKPAHAESPAAAPATPDDARPSATISEKSQRSAATGGRADIGSFLSIETLVRDLSLAEFPTLHPLVVHVPVTFIPLAFVFALVGVFVVHRAVIGLALAFALGGLAGGWVAAFPTHPHTSRLSAAARNPSKARFLRLRHPVARPCGRFRRTRLSLEAGAPRQHMSRSRLAAGEYVGRHHGSLWRQARLRSWHWGPGTAPLFSLSPIHHRFLRTNSSGLT